MLYLKFILKTVRLMVFMVSTAFFFAMFFRITLVMQMLRIQAINARYTCDDEDDQTYSLLCYEMEAKNDWQDFWI